MEMAHGRGASSFQQQQRLGSEHIFEVFQALVWGASSAVPPIPNRSAPSAFERDVIVAIVYRSAAGTEY